MKIVIFSGGTGSVQLQKGLYEVFGKDVLDYTIITNLADNGLSTGVVRKVMDGEIMGPSDLRKNQMLRAKLQNSCDEDTLTFLDQRITMRAEDVEMYLLTTIAQLDEGPDSKAILELGVRTFFEQPKALQIDYDDFSVSNIIYAGLARQYGNSLDIAGEMFERVLGIPKDSVISNTDQSMYLTATTESGYRIMDEGDIVSWNNPSDKIVACSFLDVHGKPVVPVMNSKSLKAIAEADLIIFSTGTQWSSLIPTYISKGFKDAINESSARKFLIMNSTEDKDMKGVSGDAILDILSNYLPLDNIKILAAEDGDPNLVPTSNRYNPVIVPLMIDEYSRKHDPRRLVLSIFRHYYKDQLESDTQIFDYDDTIVARGEQLQMVSISNIKLMNEIKGKEVWISTGNTPKALKRGFRNMDLLADGGVNLYRINEQGDAVFVSCIDEKLIFTNNEIYDIIKNITNVGVDVSKIQVRGKVMVSIKPIDPAYREPIVILLTSLFPEYIVKPTGRTTIDIYKPGMSKTVAADKHFIKPFTFVGDEWYEGGNDHGMSLIPRCRFLKVKDVRDTNMYLRILTWRPEWN